MNTLMNIFRLVVLPYLCQKKMELCPVSESVCTIVLINVVQY